MFFLTKRLFDDNPRVLRRPVDNRRRNKVAARGRGLHRAARRDLPPLPLNVVKKGLDALVLHRVLQRAVADARLGAVAERVGLCVLDHGVAKLVVDGLVDVDALEAEADLEYVR